MYGQIRGRVAIDEDRPEREVQQQTSMHDSTYKAWHSRLQMGLTHRRPSLRMWRWLDRIQESGQLVLSTMPKKLKKSAISSKPRTIDESRSDDRWMYLSGCAVLVLTRGWRWYE
jgi:hypothetical protein